MTAPTAPAASEEQSRQQWLRLAGRLGLQVELAAARSSAGGREQLGAAPRRAGATGIPPAGGPRIVLGRRSSAVVLDLDPGRGGDQSFRGIQQLRGRFALPPTLTVVGPAGRRQLYFSIPGDVTIPSAHEVLGQGVAIRGEGARCAWPPTVDATGEIHRLATGSPLEMARLPGDLVRRLQKRARPTRRATGCVGQTDERPQGVARARAEALGRVRTSAGGDISTLSIQALLLGKLVGLGYLDLAGIALDLAAAAQRAGLDPARATPAIRDGLAAGADLERPGSVLTVLSFFAAPHGQPHRAMRRHWPNSNPTIQETA